MVDLVHLVCLVHLLVLFKHNETDRINKGDQPVMMARAGCSKRPSAGRGESKTGRRTLGTLRIDEPRTRGGLFQICYAMRHSDTGGFSAASHSSAVRGKVVARGRGEFRSGGSLSSMWVGKSSSAVISIEPRRRI